MTIQGRWRLGESVTMGQKTKATIQYVRLARTLMLLVGASSVYSCSKEDNFECGLRKDDTVTACNGPGEFCLCDSHRCAKPDATCTQSFHAYVFSDDDAKRCVPPEQLTNVAFAQQPDKGLCADQLVVPPHCGVPSGTQATVCPSGSVCLCGVDQQCALPSDTCASKFRRFNSVDCIVPAADADVALRPNPSGFCPNSDPTIEDPRCGTGDAEGNVIKCGDAEYCMCNTHKCAASDAASCKDSGYRYRVAPAGAANSCVPKADALEIVQHGLCSGSLPAAVPCGKPGDAECPLDEQQCVCATGFCATPGQEGCASKLRYVGSGQCVAEADATVGVVEKGECSPTCGVEIDGQIQDCPIGSCRCTTGTGECVVTKSSCVSGKATLDGACAKLAQTPDFSSEVGPGVVCPKDDPAKPCGAPGRDGRLQVCAAGQACSCGPVSACTVDDARCSSGRARVDSKGVFVACSDATSALQADGLCPGQSAAPVLCGVKDPSGKVPLCAEGERCACAPEGGRCVHEDPRCASGFAGVHDGSCVSYSTDQYLSILATARVCPTSPPKAIECTSAQGTECGSEAASCQCVDGKHQCVEPVEDCETGLLYTRQAVCVSPNVTVTAFGTGACKPAAAAESL